MEEEKIIIIAVRKPEQLVERFESSLKEIISLSYTAGGKVEGVITQEPEPHSSGDVYRRR